MTHEPPTPVENARPQKVQKTTDHAAPAPDPVTSSLPPANDNAATPATTNGATSNGAAAVSNGDACAPVENNATMVDTAAAEVPKEDVNMAVVEEGEITKTNGAVTKTIEKQTETETVVASVLQQVPAPAVATTNDATMSDATTATATATATATTTATSTATTATPAGTPTEPLPENVGSGVVDAGSDAADARSGAADAGPVPTDAVPVAADAGPVAADAGPVAADAVPVAADAVPVAADAGPVAADVSPVAADVSPVAADAGSGAADAGSGAADAGSGAADAGSGAADAGSGAADAGPGAADADSGVTKKDESKSDDLTQVTLSRYMASRTKPSVVDQTCLRDDKIVSISDEKKAAFHKCVNNRKAVCVLLAAGQGSRFVSDVPKVIHPLHGKPLAQHSLDAALACDLPIVVVVGHAKEAVAKALIIPDEKKDNVCFVVQDERMGTGHAVYVASTALPEDYDGDFIVTYADNPGIDEGMMKSFMSGHESFKETVGEKYGAMSVTGSRKHAGSGTASYGRIVREAKDGKGCVIDIMEKKSITKLVDDSTTKNYGDIEWTAKELEEIDEFNSGIVVARGKQYLGVLKNLKGSLTKKEPEAKYEYYATDFVKGLVANGLVAQGFQVGEGDVWKLEGSNTVEELKELCAKMEKAKE